MSDILPDGTAAKSDKEYTDTWREFARPLKEMLGAELYAFDWGITLVKDKKMIEVPNIVVHAVNEKLTHYEAVRVAAKQIFDVVKFPRDKDCPHGNAAVYPGHAWYCDDCWHQLETALEAQDVDE